MSDSFLLACIIRESDHSCRSDHNVGHGQPAPPPLVPKAPSRDPSALDLAALASSRNNSFHLGSPKSPSRRIFHPPSGSAALGSAATVGGPPPPRRIISYLNAAQLSLPEDQQAPACNITGPRGELQQHSAFDSTRAMALLSTTPGATARSPGGPVFLGTPGGASLLSPGTPGGASLLFSNAPT